MRNNLASPLSLVVAAILGGLVSQGISRWMPEAQAQEPVVAKKVKVEQLVVLDSIGKERVVLGSLGPKGDAFGVEVLGKLEKSKIRMGVEGLGQVTLTIVDQNGKEVWKAP